MFSQIEEGALVYARGKHYKECVPPLDITAWGCMEGMDKAEYHLEITKRMGFTRLCKVNKTVMNHHVLTDSVTGEVFTSLRMDLVAFHPLDHMKRILIWKSVAEDYIVKQGYMWKKVRAALAHSVPSVPPPCSDTAPPPPVISGDMLSLTRVAYQLQGKWPWDGYRRRWFVLKGTREPGSLLYMEQPKANVRDSAADCKGVSEIKLYAEAHTTQRLTP